MVDGPIEGSVSGVGKAGNLAQGKEAKNSLAHIEPLRRTVRLTTQWRVGATGFHDFLSVGKFEGDTAPPCIIHIFYLGHERKGTHYDSPSSDFSLDHPVHFLGSHDALVRLASLGSGWVPYESFCPKLRFQCVLFMA